MRPLNNKLKMGRTFLTKGTSELRFFLSYVIIWTGNIYEWSQNVFALEKSIILLYRTNDLKIGTSSAAEGHGCGERLRNEVRRDRG
jgi:hypothetical protein